MTYYVDSKTRNTGLLARITCKQSTNYVSRRRCTINRAGFKTGLNQPDRYLAWFRVCKKPCLLMNVKSSQSWLELSASTMEDFPHKYPIACSNCCKCIMHCHPLSPPLASHEDNPLSLSLRAGLVSRAPAGILGVTGSRMISALHTISYT